jgi:hypothetical protein
MFLQRARGRSVPEGSNARLRFVSVEDAAVNINIYEFSRTLTEDSENSMARSYERFPGVSILWYKPWPERMWKVGQRKGHHTVAFPSIYKQPTGVHSSELPRKAKQWWEEPLAELDQASLALEKVDVITTKNGKARICEWSLITFNGSHHSSRCQRPHRGGSHHSYNRLE